MYWPKARVYAALTATMREYVDLRRQHPEKIILYRFGDFFEAFWDDAVICSRITGVTLTKRGTDVDGKPIPMSGMPVVNMPRYLQMIVAAGQGVVIYDQVGETKKNGKIVKIRRVTRIISPGTLTEDFLLEEKNDRHLAAVACPGRGKKRTWGIVSFTLSSGRLEGYEADDAGLAEALASVLASEILAAQGAKDLLADLCPDAVFLFRIDWNFDAERGGRVLAERFGVGSLEAGGVADKPAVLAAANAVLDYAEESMGGGALMVEPLVMKSKKNIVVIDDAALRGLEVVRSSAPDGSGPTLFSTIDHCRTGMGSRELRRRLLAPVLDNTEAYRRLDLIEALAKTDRVRDALEDSLALVPDVERIAGRIVMGTVRPPEVVRLRAGAAALEEAAAALEESNDPVLLQIAPKIRLPEELGRMIEAALNDEVPPTPRDGLLIREGYNAELDELRDIRSNYTEHLLQFEREERQRTGHGVVVKSNLVTGAWIEWPAGSEPPIDYRIKQVVSGKNRYICEGLAAIEARHISAKERALALEEKLWKELVEALSQHVQKMLSCAAAVSDLDAAYGLADHTRRFNWRRPELTEAPVFEFTKGRHPVLETLIEVYVPNDCRFDETTRFLLITGPNMGGKSTHMRMAALIALLARAGSFVPAESYRVGPVDRIFTRIGAYDDLAHGKSTFMIEMSETAGILLNATNRSLVLIDEIGRGTSTLDGMSIAAAVAESLISDTGAMTLFSTHFPETADIAARYASAKTIHADAVPSQKGLAFTYEMKPGVASSSYGIEVAKLAGLSSRAIYQAKKIQRELLDRAVAFEKAEKSEAVDDAVLAKAKAPAQQVEAPSEEVKAAIVLQDRVADLDPNAFTPMQAFLELDKLIEAAKANRQRGESNRNE